jgi:hypothetical protein
MVLAQFLEADLKNIQGERGSPVIWPTPERKPQLNACFRKPSNGDLDASGKAC